MHGFPKSLKNSKIYYSDVTWASWRHKSAQPNCLFNSLFGANKKKIPSGQRPFDIEIHRWPVAQSAGDTERVSL